MLPVSGLRWGVGLGGNDVVLRALTRWGGHK